MAEHHPTKSRKPQQDLPFLARAKHLTMGVVLAAAMALLAAPARRPTLPSQQPATAPHQSAGALQITLTPTLSPAFDPNISDYVYPYNGAPVQVAVNAPRNTKVSVDGQPFRKLAFTTSVSLTPGQSFSMVVNSLAGSQTYYVRCLPSDFPAWTTERPGTPQPEFFVAAPTLNFSGAGGHYVILADGYGVPLWWYRDSAQPIEAKLLSDGNFAWINSNNSGAERRLNGSLAHTFSVASRFGGTLDTHELLLLPNGNYIFIADVYGGPVDLSPYGGSPTPTVVDNIVTNPGFETGDFTWMISA